MTEYESSLVSMSEPEQSHLSDAGREHQNFLDSVGLRTAQGSFYTPFHMVERILEISFKDLDLKGFVKLESPFRIMDPTCGTGNFLLISALYLADVYSTRFANKDEALDWVVRNCIYGLDIDDLAVSQAKNNLSSLTSNRVHPDELSSHFHVGNVMLITEQDDLFSEDGDTWSTVFPEVFGGKNWGFDAIFGNPPFLNPLKKETAIDEFTASQVRETLGNASQALTNTATLILQISRNIIRPETGFLALVQPISIVATRDSFDVRREIDELGLISGVWICEDKVFDAAVQTCVLFITSKRQEFVEVYSAAAGSHLTKLPYPSDLGNWSRYIYTAHGLPELVFESSGTLGDVATSSNDFRDEYYGLIGSIVDSEVADDSVSPKLITVGKIDLMKLSWGDEPTKFAKEVYQYPRVEVAKLDAKMRAWAKQLAKPKLLVATQTKVIELIVDETGTLLPSIPIASVFPRDNADLWRIAACLAAPVTALYSLSKLAGAGMNAEVLKISSRFISTIPLPIGVDEWDEASALLREAHLATDGQRHALLVKYGLKMCSAYRVTNTDEIVSWWETRI